MIFWWLLGAALFVGLAIAALAGFSVYMGSWVARALPPRGRFIEIDGHRLHYADEGSGPAVVMIHGLGAQLQHFTHSLVGRLSGDHRVVAFDRPGAGYSTRAPGSAANLRAQAATTAKLIAALKLDRPIVVGHSLGGAIALALAMDHPEAVGGLALIAPLTQPQDSVPPAFKALAVRSPTLRQVIAHTLAIPAAMLARDTALAPIFGPEAAPPDFGVRAGGALWLRPSSFYNTSTDLIAVNADLPGMVTRYATLGMPVGILYGTGDRLLDHREHGEAMRGKIPGLELDLVPGGHMLPITQPDLTADFIRRIEARIDRTGATSAA